MSSTSKKRDMSGNNNPFYGKTHSDEQKRKWSRDRLKTGYTMSTGYLRNTRTGQLKHREIMEEHLGRSLREDEIVHHINENRLDNRIENLQLTNRHIHMVIHKGKVRKQKCEYCAKTYFPKAKHRRYCSCRCSAESYKRQKREMRSCINCGAIFEVVKSNPKTKCSRLCHLNNMERGWSTKSKDPENDRRRKPRG